MEKFDWNQVYQLWKYYASTFEIAEIELADFQEIQVDRLPYDLDRFGVDWWPKKDVQKRSVSLLKNSPYLPYWETRKGTLHTAQELVKSQESVEQQVAVWIMASIWDKKHNLPPEWRGDTFRLLENLFRVTREAFPDISVWHSAARWALPLSIGPYDTAPEFMHPHTFEHLIYLTLLEAGLISANWQLVRFVPRKPT